MVVRERLQDGDKNVSLLFEACNFELKREDDCYRLLLLVAVVIFLLCCGSEC